MPYLFIKSKKAIVILASFACIFFVILIFFLRNVYHLSPATTIPLTYVVGIDQKVASDDNQRLTQYTLQQEGGQGIVLFSLPINSEPSNIMNGRIVAFEESKEGQNRSLSFFMTDLTQDPIIRQSLFRIPENLNTIAHESIVLLSDGRVIVSVTEQTEESVVPLRMYVYTPTSGVQRIQSALLPSFSDRRWLGVDGQRVFFLQKSTEACITDIGMIDLQSGEETWIAQSMPEQPLCVVPSGLSVDRQWILFENRTVTSSVVPMGWSVFHMNRQEFLPIDTTASDSVGNNSTVWDSDANKVAAWVPNEQNTEGTTRGGLLAFDPEARETTEQQLTIPASEASLLWKKGAMMLYKGVVRTDNTDASGLSHVLVYMNGRSAKELLRSQHNLIFIGVVEKISRN